MKWLGAMLDKKMAVDWAVVMVAQLDKPKDFPLAWRKVVWLVERMED